MTDLYTKQTDTHQLLHRSSCHPYHTKKGIPYGQALRIRRNCSEDSMFDERMGVLKSWLIGRGYHEGEIDSQLDKVRQLDREILLNGNSKQKDDTRIPLVLTYHPALQGVSNILRKCANILLVDDEHRKQFAGRVIVSFRRAKNLKDTLVCAKLQTQDQELVQKGTFKCSGKRCQICPIIQEGCNFSNANDSRSFKNFSEAYDCNSTNVVYMLQCTCCNKKYVGSTKTECRQRFNVYKSFVVGKLNENIGKPKDLWKCLKSLGLSSGNNSTSKICLNDKGKPSLDDKTKAEIFKDFFSNLASDLVKRLNPSPHRLDSMRKYYQHLNLTEPFSLLPTSTDYVLKLLEEINPSKATGLDNIAGKFLKDGDLP